MPTPEQQQWAESVLGVSFAAPGDDAAATAASNQLPVTSPEIAACAADLDAFYMQNSSEMDRLIAALQSDDLGEIDRAAALLRLRELRDGLNDRIVALERLVEEYSS